MKQTRACGRLPGAAISLLLIFAFLLKPADGFGQHYDIKNMTVRDGLPSSFVYKCYEDSKGYIWFLTNSGISRFDGKVHAVYGHTQGFTDAGGYQVVEAPDGSLWFVSFGFNVYCYRDGRFSRFAVPAPVSWIHRDPSGNLWLLGRHGEIFSVNYITHAVSQLPPLLKSSGSYFAYSLMYAGDSGFLIGTHLGVFYHDYRQGRATRILEARPFVDFITPRFFSVGAEVLITTHEGVFSFDTRTHRAGRLFDLKGNQVFDCCLDASGDLVLGTFRGVFRLRQGRWTSDPELLLADQMISSVLHGRDGNLWLGTFGSGVHWYNSRARHYNSLEGLTNIPDFIQQEHGNVYVISVNGTISLLKDGKFTEQSGKFSVPDPIQYVATTHDSVVWVHSASCYAISRQQIIRTRSRPGFAILRTGGKDFPYLGSSLGVLKRDTVHAMLTRSQAARIMKTYSSLIPSATEIYPLFITDRTVYYPGFREVLEIDIATCSLKRRLKVAGEPVALHWTPNGGMVISTSQNGLYILRNGDSIPVAVAAGRMDAYWRKTYLRDNSVWVCTNKGLLRMMLSADDRVVQVTNFTANDFLPSTDVNDMLFRGTDVMVATPAGVSVFPVDAQLVLPRPTVLIERVQVNNKDTNINGYLDLPYDQNNITVEFNSPGARSGGRNMYRYVLQSGKSDTITLANGILQLGSLQPGEYTLKAWAGNIDGIWSTQPASFSFRIGRPFWKTAWFVLAVFAFAAALAGYFFYTRLKGNRIRYELISSELKALRLYMNPHFIFNSLNSLHGYILKREKERASAFIISFSKLIRTIMIHSEKKAVTLAQECELIRLYLELEHARFGGDFSYEINVSELPNTNVMIPPLVIQPFVENAIKYGIGGRADGRIEVVFRLQDDLIVCMVDDNGVGRVAAAELQRSAGKEYESTGIRYIADRLGLLFRGRLNDPVSIIDKTADDGSAAGTRVLIKLPLL